jgi:hypothetical protein
VRPGRVIAGESDVQALLGFLERTFELEPELTKAWCTNRDKE